MGAEHSVVLCRWNAWIEPGYGRWQLSHTAGQAFMAGMARVTTEVGAEGA